jgi:pimeloyl-ACP methyl ester carboxylesterase
VKRKALLLAGGAAAAAVLALAVFFAAPYEVVTAARREALWASGVRRVRLDEGLLAYERDGCRPGRPCRCVALIHGMGDSALTWDKILLDPKASADGLRVVAPDMPGTDGSAPAPDPAGYGIHAQAKVLRAALAGRCPEWTVAGNSLGGWIALWLALDWPQGVQKLVLVDAAGISDPSGREEESARTLAAPTVESMKVFSRRARFEDRALPERAWTSAVAAILRRPTQAIFAALSRGELLDARLGALKVPTTIIWGEADGIIPVEVGERLHRLIAGSRYELASRCGHLPQAECPDVVVRALFDDAAGAPR